MPPITVALVEDHSLVREGLVSLLAGEPGIKVVGEASDGKGAIKLVQKTQPDVLLLDLILPRMHGFDVLRKVHTETKVIAISMRADDAFVAEALQIGARGYIVKEATCAELVDAINEVAAGHQYISPLLNQRSINRLLKRWQQNTAPDASLTTREQVVLQLSADGKTSNQIGECLEISPRTVEMHRGNLMRKLGLVTQTDLVRFAIRKHIISA